MGRYQRNRSTLLAATATVIASVALFLSPAATQRSLRSAVLDVVGPAQGLAAAQYHAGRDWLVAKSARLAPGARPFSADAADAGARAAALEQVCRRLRVENARLREELSLAEKYGVSPVPAAAQRAGEIPSAVRASLIRSDSQSAVAEQLLSSGRAQGIAESDIVVNPSRPRLDQGSEAGVGPELDVLIGRCVVGRIGAVGRWASALEPLTDPSYRGLAQIIRPSDQGGSFGAEGILVGQGAELLKLAEVPTTQSVRIGDEVYTSDRDRRFPVPLYYGRVVRVEASERTWNISVRPAVRIQDLKTVEILKIGRQAGKILAQ
jgi:hypothetical protein